MKSLDQILDLLDGHHQRATYGAVAAALGKTPRSLMQGHRKDWRHSWVVNKDTGLPSEYPKGLIHPAIQERDEVLDTEAALQAWLREPGNL
ncbi:MAG: hypothetical protein ACREOQ_23260 [Gemmatimonadales bacterium]